MDFYKKEISTYVRPRFFDDEQNCIYLELCLLDKMYLRKQWEFLSSILLKIEILQIVL